MDRSPAEIFAEHCRRLELAYQVGPDGQPVFRPRVGHDEWRVSAGHGTVHATVVARPRDSKPYNIALVDLDEGFRMMSRVVGIEPEAVVIGMRVGLDWDQSTETPIPVFTPERASGA